MRKISFLIMFVLSALTIEAAKGSSYDEPYRPQYHFSPEKGWIGDPSGLTYYLGKYHLFWWGKAVSTDLVHYEQITPNVMRNTPAGMSNFTGSMVIDKHNTAGWGTNAWIAVMTVYEQDSKKQAQGIAFSHDGENFYHYDQNPVLDLWSTEFRDPTVFWHEPTRKWIMVVAKAREKKVQFYSSTNLKEWIWESDFGPSGNQEKAWECPDLFLVPVNGDWNDRKWVLLTSINWAQEQYFIGDFDGHKFTLMDNHPAEPFLVDRGLDYYASRVFRDYDGTLRNAISMGWLATWDYAPLAPSAWGKGFWSVPRIYNLKSFKEGMRLTQQPIEELKTLRGKPFRLAGKIPVGAKPLKGFSPKSNAYELDAVFDARVENTYGFYLCKGQGHQTIISYDTRSHTLLIDRTNSSDVEIPKFKRIAQTEVYPENGKLRLHIYVDKSSIEIFTNQGKEVFSLLTYAGDAQTGIETFALRPGTWMQLNAWTLDSIWK